MLSVVFGNEEHKPSFMPNKHGMEHLSVMAIVCGGQLVRHPYTRDIFNLFPAKIIAALWYLG